MGGHALDSGDHLRWGDPRLPERFWDKVVPVPEAGCWLWIGSTTSRGYGSFYLGQGEDGRQRTGVAHKMTYETLHGPIPQRTGDLYLVVDHKCRNRSCVNPAHLRAIPEPVNIAIGTSQSARNAAKTHCPRGHAYDAENTVVYVGKRYCLTCQDSRRR